LEAEGGREGKKAVNDEGLKHRYKKLDQVNKDDI
jgi:hypothetical protein